MSGSEPAREHDELRQEAQRKLEGAVGEGRLTLEEYGNRVGVVWSAGSRAEIEQTLSDLPQAVVGSSQPARSTLFSLFGTVRRRGRWLMRRETTAVSIFGSLKLDLRGAVISDSEVTITAFSLFGDIDITVPEGVEVDLSGFDIFGDREINLAAVPRIPGSPQIRVRAVTPFGDVEVVSER